MKLPILIVFIFLFANVRAFYTRCSHTNAPGPDHIVSPNCNSERCFGVRGDVVNADIWATPLGAHTELRTRITAFILGIGVPLPVDPPFDDACNMIFLDGQLTTCPTIPNRQYMLQVEIPILHAYPPFSNAIVRVEFFDRGQLAACGEVLADII
ncbi:hypothetical protein PVAND_004327 [Polypedilum vanderplanki]|uniref:MD-2-related lipid-recognition domain-containing protein n=1 Tax=Polypedilum vanderplanki TaxID=319348 RepID=A0A9J6BXD3_POLVA|nr:hypothetical protein PVAND_004327 [Polypedilum vanderplanki]